MILEKPYVSHTNSGDTIQVPSSSNREVLTSLSMLTDLQKDAAFKPVSARIQLVAQFVGHTFTQIQRGALDLHSSRACEDFIVELMVTRGELRAILAISKGSNVYNLPSTKILSIGVVFQSLIRELKAEIIQLHDKQEKALQKECDQESTNSWLGSLALEATSSAATHMKSLLVRKPQEYTYDDILKSIQIFSEVIDHPILGLSHY